MGKSGKVGDRESRGQTEVTLFTNAKSEFRIGVSPVCPRIIRIINYLSVGYDLPKTVRTSVGIGLEKSKTKSGPVSPLVLTLSTLRIARRVNRLLSYIVQRFLTFVPLVNKQRMQGE